MTTYYVGIGGSDAANGLSWANRKLTLNGAEDVPVAAADTVYVGPGAYRHLLTLDVSGTAGNPITYIADVTGQNTDGVGGIVRITGSDNDTTATRANCITGTSRDYRTFRGFKMDITTGAIVNMVTSCDNWIIEDCTLEAPAAAVNSISMAGSGVANTIRRCLFIGTGLAAVDITHSSVVDNAGHVIENCVVWGGRGNGVMDNRVGGVTVRNCVFWALGLRGVRVVTALTAGQFMNVNNCILAHIIGPALQATTTAEFAEDFNSLFSNGTDRTNVSVGAASNAFPPLFNPLMLLAGMQLPQFAPLSLSEWSPLRAITGSGTAADDFFGGTRPATAAKLSWGAVQYVDQQTDTGTVRTGSRSWKLADAGRVQFIVPTTAVSTTFSVYVQREADYTGTAPQMVIKQPGVADTTVTDAGAVSTWNELTTTLTPAALPPYVIVELVSNNTAAATNFDTFFDDLVVS